MWGQDDSFEAGPTQSDSQSCAVALERCDQLPFSSASVLRSGGHIADIKSLVTDKAAKDSSEQDPAEPEEKVEEDLAESGDL